MSTLEELHKAYMNSKDDFDNYNVDDDYEAKQLNEYYNLTDEVSEVHWEPVSNIPNKDKLIKMKKFNEGR